MENKIDKINNKESEESNLEQLINDTLNSCAEYIPKLKDASMEVAELIHSSDNKKALSMMPSIFEGLGWLVEAVNALQKHNCLLDIDLKVLMQKLEEVKSALEKRDYVLTADLFEYEIEPILDNWLEKVNEHIQAY